METNLKNSWRYTIELHLVYVGVFVSWMFVTNRVLVLAIGVGAAVGLVALGWRVHRKGYFYSGAERFMHLCVIADIVGEAYCYFMPSLERKLQGMDFLFCAAAFAVVIFGYRWIRIRKTSSQD